MKSKSINWPKVSIILITFNGESSIKQTLLSLKKLTYPKNKLEIIISDNNSDDNTVKIIKSYFNKVYISRAKVYVHRAEAMRRSTGEFVFMILEQDMEIKSTDFIQKMIRPLIEDTSIAGSFTREYPRKDQPWVTRFISYDPIQRDPLFEFLTPSIESTVIAKKHGYYLCDYKIGKIPPTTHMLFRVEYLKKTKVWNQKKDFDHDTVSEMVKSGYNKFAYIPSAGTYHHHAKNLKQLIGKRIRNLNNHYFPLNETLEYKWLNVNDKKSLFKMFIWIIYANLLFPALFRGFYRALKFKDSVLLMEPVVTVTTTDVILWIFITSPMGRKIIRNYVMNIFK